MNRTSGGARLRRATLWVRPLVVALVFSSLLYGVFFLVRDISFLGNVAEDALDRRMDLLVDLKHACSGATGFAFIDFDAETLERLGDPPLLPPAVIAATLSSIASLDPEMVFVDVDLTWLTDPHDVAVIADALTALSSHGTPVLLARGVLAGRGAERRFRPAALDPIVASDPNLLWVGVDAHLSGDATVRRVSPIVQGRLNGHPTTLPSPQLAALLIARTGGPDNARKAFQRGIAGGRQPCGLALSNERLFCIGDGNRITVEGGRADVVEFTMKWPPKDFLRLYDRNGADTGSFVTHLPAWGLLQNGASPGRDRLSQRIVVIGSSAVDRKDFYETPVGQSPGAFILINAMNAWVSSGPPQRREFAAGLLLVLGLTAFSFFISTATLSLTPQRFRKTLRSILPALVTAALWVVFCLNGDVASPALIVIQYATAVILIAASRVSEPSVTDDAEQGASV